MMTRRSWMKPIVAVLRQSGGLRSCSQLFFSSGRLEANSEKRISRVGGRYRRTAMTLTPAKAGKLCMCCAFIRYCLISTPQPSRRNAMGRRSPCLPPTDGPRRCRELGWCSEITSSQYFTACETTLRNTATVSIPDAHPLQSVHQKHRRSS